MSFFELFKRKKQFIPFITCGFPNKKGTIDIIKLLLDEGVEIIEIGIPFSDPVADGPTIQYSSFIALKNGANIDNTLEVIKKTIGYKKYIPIIMTYLNPVIVYGIDRFVRDAKEIGVEGVIFADAVVEEKEVFYPLTKKYGIHSIFLLSPTTEFKRRKLIYKFSTGFIYLITLTGTTGAREKLPKEFYNFVKQIRKETDIPLCIGFGISKPKQVLPVIDYIDGFIIGSAIIEKIKKDKTFKLLKNFVKQFVNLEKEYEK